MRSDVLLYPGACGGAADDVGERRLLKASACEPAEDRVGRIGMTAVAQPPKLAGEAGGHGLAAQLAALAATDEQRSLVSVELEIAPLERAELRPPKPRGHEREEYETVAFDEAWQVALGTAGSVEQAAELLPG